MRVTKIRAVGPTTVDFPLELADPDGPYLLKGADGLNPVEVDVLRNGERRPHEREIVLLVGLQPDYDVGQTSEELRRELYGLLTPKYKSLMELQFFDGATQNAYVEGQVKKMEAGLFTPEPEVQITVKCVGATKSYLLAPDVVVQTPPRPRVSGHTLVEVENEGDAPSGFRIGMEFDVAVDLADGVVITDNSSDGQWMRVNKAFAVGERLIIDTREGSRGIWSVEPNTSAQIVRINEFDEDSDWMTFHHGTNELKINAEFNWYDGGITHTPAFWGV